jgi:RNA polymerase sigma-70 factor (ECF subfamily)
MTMPFDAFADVSDDALLVLYANGDADAARALNARLTPRVFRQALRLLGDRAEAEDVAQEALLRLWRIAPQWRQGEAKVTTWLYRVVSNLCTDRLRKRRETDLSTVPEAQDDRIGPEGALQQEARFGALRDALAQLPDRQQQAVSLRHLEGLTNPQIAEIMGISTEAVESLTARGKRALGAILAGRRAELGYTDE